ncbi:hypothetical protein GCM10027614_56050 [Micromonospora vulcania]
MDLVAAASGASPPSPASRAVQRSAAERHVTMQATVTWSYRTLGPRAARLLRWLAVFAGPVDLPTVEWLLGDDPLDPLSVLVDKSMVLAEPRAGQHLPNARPDPRVRGAEVGRGGRGAGGPGPARGLVGTRAGAGPPGPGRPARDAVALRARPVGRGTAGGTALVRHRR